MPWERHLQPPAVVLRHKWWQEGQCRRPKKRAGTLDLSGQKLVEITHLGTHMAYIQDAMPGNVPPRTPPWSPITMAKHGGCAEHIWLTAESLRGIKLTKCLVCVQLPFLEQILSRTNAKQQQNVNVKCKTTFRKTWEWEEFEINNRWRGQE